jgi:hypothetical protein
LATDVTSALSKYPPTSTGLFDASKYDGYVPMT